MKRLTRFLAGLLCYCLYFPEFGFAQVTSPSVNSPENSAGTITGIVADSLTGNPVEFATVTLFPKGSKQPLTGMLTDKHGLFTFSKLPLAGYILNVSYLGYKSKNITVALTGQQPALQLGKIVLKPATEQLKEVTVQAMRPTIIQEADKMVVSIEGTALAAGRSALEVLATSPGVFIDHEGNIQLNGRSGVTLMLDGKLTYLSARELRTLLEGMPAENIKNIEIITNPSAKYDAEGSSGILNMNMKKNTTAGLNGSIYAGSVFNGKQFAYSTGISINHKNSKWNSFLNLDQVRRAGGREGVFTRVFYGENQTVYFDQLAESNSVNEGPPTYRAGIDYSLNNKHSLGIVSGFNRNTRWEDFSTSTLIGNRPGQPEEHITAKNYTTNTFTSFTANLHYTAKLDSAGTSLTSDLDYVKIANLGFSHFNNYFVSVAGQRPDRADHLYADSDNGFDIYSAKADYSGNFAKAGKLELGLKASRVISDNDSRFFFNNIGLVLDPKRTNHFVYHENILAAYANYNQKLGEKITLQAGLRIEHTRSLGNSFTTGHVTKRSYLSWFPAIFLQHKVSDNYQVGYSYSQRIQRPNYGQLNPFIIYRDPYTYSTGNPYLQPQFSQTASLTQTLRKTYSLTINYQLNQDVIAEIPVVIPDSAVTIYYTGNVDAAQFMSMTAVVPVKILKNWDCSNTATLAFNEYSMVVNNKAVLNGQTWYRVQTSHNLLLPYSIKMEVTAAYQSPATYALYRVASRWWVNAGLKKSFMKDKLDLSLNVTDIFRTQRVMYAANLGDRNVNDFNQYFRNRTIGLTVRYKFSKGQKFEIRQQNNNLDELNRT